MFVREFLQLKRIMDFFLKNPGAVFLKKQLLENPDPDFFNGQYQEMGRRG
jgi:hypothetical protein